MYHTGAMRCQGRVRNDTVTSPFTIHTRDLGAGKITLVFPLTLACANPPFTTRTARALTPQSP